MTTILTRTFGTTKYRIKLPLEMVQGINETIAPEPDRQKIPGSGPASNIGTDFNGVEKTITINGSLVDVDSTIVYTVTGSGESEVETPVSGFTTKESLKYLLEAFANGNQTGNIVTIGGGSWHDYTLESSDGTTTINGVEIPGAWVLTKGYCTNVIFDDEEANPNIIPFKIDFWIAGF